MYRKSKLALLVLVMVISTGCSQDPDASPPTVAPASAAASPPLAERPAGEVRPFAGRATAAVFDAATSSLVVSDSGIVTVFPAAGGTARSVALPGPATALTGDGRGTVYLSTRGGYLRVDVRSGSVTVLTVEPATDFTAIARRADGRLVLGTADGAVYTLSSDTAVAARVDIFARVDALAAQGNTVLVLDRGQTSVTALDESGEKREQALRAGEGATTMTVDPAGRVLVADTRGDELLVFGADPLMMRQRYPVRAAPYGLAGSSSLAWVSATAANLVIGYDLDTGIPVEKVRYVTVRQPNSLAFDDATRTLFIVSAAGDGVQVITDAGMRR